MSTILTNFKLFISGLECLALPNFYTLRCPNAYLVRNTSEQFHKFMILLRSPTPLFRTATTATHCNIQNEEDAAQYKHESCNHSQGSWVCGRISIMVIILSTPYCYTNNDEKTCWQKYNCYFIQSKKMSKTNK